MKIIHRNEQHNGKCNLEPSNMPCIYMTLKYIFKIRKAYNVLPVVAFDQTLWLKAMEIVSTETADETVDEADEKVDSFVGQLSHPNEFFGNHGTYSGLSEIFETAYARNSVMHILSGKAYDRSVHAPK